MDFKGWLQENSPTIPFGYWIKDNGAIEIVREFDGSGQHEEPVIHQIIKNHNLTQKDISDIVNKKYHVWDEVLKSDYGFSQEEVDAFEDLQTARKIGFFNFKWHRVFGNEIETASLSPKSIKEIAIGLGKIYPQWGEHQHINIETINPQKYYVGIPINVIKASNSPKDIYKFLKI